MTSDYRVKYAPEMGCWTYKDSKGYGPSLGYAHNRYASKEEATKYLELVALPLLAVEGGPLSREAYVAACEKLRVEPLTDAEVDSYGVRYGAFTHPHYTVGKIQQMRLAKRRLKALDEAPAPQPCPEPQKAPWGRSGVRYDESCASCRKETTIDNETELCRRCS